MVVITASTDLDSFIQSRFFMLLVLGEDGGYINLFLNG